MTNFNFMLTLSGALTDARVNALFEAGCDDATLSTEDDATFAEFDREAPTLIEALFSTIAAVETVDGVEVLSAGLEEPVWASEIAERTGRTRQSINMLIKGKRGPGDFPAPMSHATRNPLWRWSEVEEWFAKMEGCPTDPERAAAIAVTNGTLDVRRALRQSASASHLHEAMNSFLSGSSNASADENTGPRPARARIPFGGSRRGGNRVSKTGSEQPVS